MGRGLFFNLLFILFFSSPLLPIANAHDAISHQYMLPEDHPIKPFLDAIFSSSRVILNRENLKKAGFLFSKPRQFTHLIIASHPSIPGYIFKLYLDAQRYHKHKPEEHFWLLRVQGALKVRHEIEVHQFQHLMKVPQKWLYKLPKKPKSPEGFMPKHYILVEEDMYLLDTKENENLWRSPFVSPELLEALFTIVSRVGLSDCMKPDNIPFSIDGRIAFIDTQTHGQTVDYDRLKPWLSLPNQTYWHQLMDSF